MSQFDHRGDRRQPGEGEDPGPAAGVGAPSGQARSGVASLLLDEAGSILNLTPEMAGLLSLGAADIGRPLVAAVGHALCDRLLESPQGAAPVLLGAGPHRLQVAPGLGGGVVLTLTAIDEVEALRTALTESLDQLQLVQQVARMVIWEWRPAEGIHGGTITGDVRTREFFGVRHDTDRAEAYWSRVHPGDAERLREALAEAWALQEPYSFRFRCLHPLRGVRLLSSQGVFLGPEEDRYSLVVSWDITEQDRAERERIRQGEELKRINRELEQFAVVAAHDLRQPLRTVVSFLEIIEEDFGEQLPEQAMSCLQIARDGGRHMGQLLEGLLKLSGVRRYGEPFVVTDLGQVVEDVIGAVRYSLPPGSTITAAALPSLRVDGAQLTVVFRNLIDNALKYAHPDRPARIHIEARQLNAFWEFAVLDNGIGIEPAFYDRIFVVFQRLHTQDEFPGAGIGLALCQRIIERHGGRIWVGPAPGGGCRFAFIVPRRPAS